jgi:hypothetical protein
MKRNCWEFMECGREPGGAFVGERGVCSAAIDTTHDGKNGGTNAGRYCWKVAGTLCGGKTEGYFASMLRNCSSCCNFYELVKGEEGLNWVL